MGPENNNWEIKPGHIWLVPLDEKGEIALGPARELRAEDFGWGEDQGLDGGPEGGLNGGLDGALEQFGPMTYTIEVEVTPEESLRWAAILSGRTYEEYLDLVVWAHQSRWLRAVTGLNWGSFE